MSTLGFGVQPLDNGCLGLRGQVPSQESVRSPASPVFLLELLPWRKLHPSHLTCQTLLAVCQRQTEYHGKAGGELYRFLLQQQLSN